VSGVDNLKPVRTKDEARERGRSGGKKSGKARREKKLMSQIYADILADQHGKKKGKKIKDVVQEIIEDGGSPAVSMLKEIREATEGSKVDIGDSVFQIIIENATKN
jgi:hypothetical protein